MTLNRIVALSLLALSTGSACALSIETTLVVTIDPAPSCVYSRSIAVATTSWELMDFCYPCGSGTPYVPWGNEFDYDLEPDTCGSHAFAQAGTQSVVENGCDTGYWARAVTSTSSGSLSAYTWLGLADFYPDGPAPGCLGFAAAVSEPKMEFESASDWTASVAFDAATVFVFDVSGTTQRGMLIGVVTVDEVPQMPMLVVMTPNGYGNQGCSLGITDAGDDIYIYDWTKELTVAGAPGEHSISASIQFAQDNDLDVTADGRFSDADVGALADIVGTSAATDPDNVARWDFDGDGAVDDDDIALMQLFIDAGAGGGVFGDANGDGLVDCADYAAASPYPLGATVSDPEYIPALDQNLDGLLDQDDLNAFLAARSDGSGGYYCCPGDANFDGIVDTSDFGVMATHWGQTVPIGSNGDLNYDGVVNIYDQTVYINNQACNAD